MEEDAGKLTHIGGATGRIQGADYSLVDYNRGGVPLVEIVTKPIYGGEHRRARDRQGLRRSDPRHRQWRSASPNARMERGNLRCDANVSLRPRGCRATLGTRTETKNVNSLRSVERAVRYEIQRQAAILADGRHHHAGDPPLARGHRRRPPPAAPSRDADDYRYFPEPDLLPVAPSARAESRSCAPRCPSRRPRAASGCRPTGASPNLEFQDVVNSGLLDEVEATVAAGAAPQPARKWWTGEIARLANAAGVAADSLVDAARMSPRCIALVDAGTLTDRLARQVLEGVIAGEGTPQRGRRRPRPRRGRPTTAR